MHRSGSFLTFAGAVTALAAMAACSPDAPNPVAPAASASVAAPSAAGRYILVSSSSFPSDLAARVAKLGGSVERVHNGAGIAVVTGISDANAAKLSTISGVSGVQPDMIVSLDAPMSRVITQAPADVIASQGNPAHAALAGWQWNMFAIGADKAWAARKLGSSAVTVAIIDTGIDYGSPDLSGLVDLSRSTSFVTSDAKLIADYAPPGSDPVSDLNGHGTNVATQVSSKAAFFAGVTSKTSLIGVKVLDATGHGSLFNVLDGVLWAADHGANVANMSLGGGFAKAGNGAYVGLINRVFNYAARKNTLVVVAAGNSGADLDHDGNSLPTYCAQPQVMCVSAVGPAVASDLATAAIDAPAFYTNYGRSAISVAAPGGNADAAHGFPLSAWPWPNFGGNFWMASWVWSLCSSTTIAYDSKGAPTGLAGCQLGPSISGDIGTSQATPHVSGLAALIIAEKGITQPAQVKAAIEQSAIDLGQPGVDPFYGKGLISVKNALGL